MKLSTGACVGVAVSTAIVLGALIYATGKDTDNNEKEGYFQWPPSNLIKGVSPQPLSHPSSNIIFTPTNYRYEVRGPMGDMFLPGPSMGAANAQSYANRPVGDIYVGDNQTLQLSWDGRFPQQTQTQFVPVREEIQTNAWAWR
jgi:hypothetical protein